MSDLHKEGIYEANRQILGESSTTDPVLLRERSQGETRPVMCSLYKGFYSKRRIALHKKSCSSGTGLTATSVDFSAGEPQDVSEEFQRNILESVKWFFKRQDHYSKTFTDTMCM